MKDKRIERYFCPIRWEKKWARNCAFILFLFHISFRKRLRKQGKKNKFHANHDAIFSQLSNRQEKEFPRRLFIFSLTLREITFMRWELIYFSVHFLFYKNQRTKIESQLSLNRPKIVLVKLLAHRFNHAEHDAVKVFSLLPKSTKHLRRNIKFQIMAVK